YGGDIPMDFSGVQDQLQEQAEKQLTSFGERYSIPSERLHLMIGRPESQIHQIAEDISADLIVVGSHGRQGLALILGSTANGVLHGAHCDVLAVRVGE
ncbi:MAG TPA: universal stress protein UspA, partial [Spongiibacteraceae bacterium]|nr:universal stress protein UspA [Spongiibacteraceae bacterium]